MPLAAGLSWVRRGFRLFGQAPLMWLLAVLVFFLFGIVVSLVPILGSIVVQVLTPVFTAGFMVACRSLETGGDFELEHLLAGFKLRFAKLAVIGLIFVAGCVAILLVFALFAGFSVLGAIMTGQTNPDDLMAILMASAVPILLGLLIMAALFIPLLAAYWFAPMLVVMHDVAPVAAMKSSFGACLRNFLTYLVYGIVMTIAGFLAVIPFGLGMFIWVPVTVASTYVAYRQIFTED